MTPEYLEKLADLADPNQHWRKDYVERNRLTVMQRQQMDAGVALRRHASDLRVLRDVLLQRRSLLITPLSPNGRASKVVDTPPEHARIRGERYP